MSGKYLLVSHLKIINANAASTPYTIGFPAMTAWLGMVHALERHLREKDDLKGVRLPSVAVSCHACDLQVFRDKNNRNDSIIGMAVPLRKKNKSHEFTPAPFIELPRCHLEVSLLIKVDGLDDRLMPYFEKAVSLEIPRLKAAGGDIICNESLFRHCRVYDVGEDDAVTEQRIKKFLMPGHMIIDRSDLLSTGESDYLDRLLDVMQNITPSNGWVVPIAIGFHDLSGEITVNNQRSYDYEHHFVEPLVTMGEFIIPYRLNSLEDMMWSYDYDESEGLYVCRNNKKAV